MCTLIVATNWFAGAPLIVAANRDERLDRPARPPFVWPDRGILAPQDEEAGGTWLGLNRHGVFVGITNRHLVERDPARRSRGDIVLQALEHETAKLAFDALSKLDASRENGFHLVMADRDGAYLVWGDGRDLTATTLEPGIHLLTERSFDAAPTGREPLLRNRLDDLARDPAPDDDTLRSLLALQVQGGHFDDVTVHVPSLGYGTRSATIVRLEDGGTRVLHADGPPTSTPFVAYEPP